MTRFDRYADFVELDEQTLRTILDGEGDAPERVWAAWALAVRRVPDAAAALVGRAASDPSEGVRAHLALMLVALGGRDVASVLAQGDPAPVVRATAYRCLARSAGAADAPFYERLLRALEEEAPAVRAALLDGLRTDAPVSVVTRALASVSDADVEVRDAVVDFALRQRLEGAPLARVVCARAEYEPDPALCARLFDAWIESDGVDNVLRAAARWSVAQLLSLLQHCEKRASLVLMGLDALAELAEPSVDRWLITLERNARVQLPVAWHVAMIRRQVEASDDEPWNDRRWERLQAAGSAHDLLAQRLTQRAAFDEGERALFATLGAVIERHARQAWIAHGLDPEDVARFTRRDPVSAATRAVLEEAMEDDYEDEVPWTFGFALLPLLHAAAVGT